MWVLRGSGITRRDRFRPRVTVVLPVLEEAALIGAALEALLAQGAEEVLVVDGGSQDQTMTLAREQVDAFGRAGQSLRVLLAPRGRARQLNLGAAEATGDILLFVHADTRLPVGGVKMVRRAWSRGAQAGWFAWSLDAQHCLASLTTFLGNIRTRLSRIATGDMGIFVCRSVFERLGGYPDVPLMEDVLLTRQLRRHARLIFIPTPVVTSARRWEQAGWVRTILWMWAARLVHMLGVSPRWLAARYPNIR